MWFTTLICGLQPCMTLSQASFRQLAEGPLEEDLLSVGSFGLLGEGGELWLIGPRGHFERGQRLQSGNRNGGDGGI